MKNIIFIIQPILYFIGLYTLYSFKGYPNNAYNGYNQIEFDIYTIIGILWSIFHYVFLFRKNFTKPSDFFIVLYTYLIFFPYVILHGIWGRNDTTYLTDLILLYLPMFIIYNISSIAVVYPSINMTKQKIITASIIFLCLILSLILLNNPTKNASFSLSSSYIRRLEARDIYAGQIFITYGSGIIMNGILPMLAFFSSLYKKRILILLSLSLYILMYYIYGVKAPIIYFIASYILGVFILKSSINKFIKYLICIIIISFYIAWIEFIVFNYSYIEDYLIRRLFYVSSYLIGAYFEYFSSNLNPSILFGNEQITSASMYIGENYLNKIGLNANSNTFLYFLIQYGILGYLLSIAFVGCIFSFFNYVSKKNPLFIYFGFIYSVLILEQSATTALVSSGIGILALFYYITISKQST